MKYNSARNKRLIFVIKHIVYTVRQEYLCHLHFCMTMICQPNTQVAGVKERETNKDILHGLRVANESGEVKGK